MRLKLTESGLADFLIALWIAAGGVVFTLLPILDGSRSCGIAEWAWDVWRYPYVVVLLASVSGAALRACRRASSRRVD